MEHQDSESREKKRENKEYKEKETALHFNNPVKSFIIWYDTKSKQKKTSLVSLEHFYELFTTENVFEGFVTFYTCVTILFKIEEWAPY